MSSYQGESEKLVARLFEYARSHKPCVIFIDEIEAITSTRSAGTSSDGSLRVKSQLLVEMQKDDDQVLLLGATNLPEMLDSAFRRRFEKWIYISLPGKMERLLMLKTMLAASETPSTLKDEELENIANATYGYIL